MSDVVIRAENLGKKYRIRHQRERQRYVALRDVFADKLLKPWRWMQERNEMGEIYEDRGRGDLKKNLGQLLIRVELPGSKLWLSWFLILVVVLVVHSLTLTISPTIWQDEAQIVELGRVALFEPHSSWSITWSPLDNRPVIEFSYLGPALQELAYRITEPSFFGPRLASLLGAGAAATMALGWLLSRGTPRFTSLILALVFLLDPIFVQSYRGARVDCWALAFIFGACWAVCSANGRKQGGRAYRWVLILSGTLAALAFFSWATSVLLYPLVLAEIVIHSWKEHERRNAWMNLIESVTAMAIGGFAITIVLIIPLWEQIRIYLHDISTSLYVNQPRPHRSFLIHDFWESHKRSPFLIISAMLGTAFTRNKRLTLSALLVLLYLLITKVYIFRVLYFVPYEIGLVSGIYQPSSVTPSPIYRWAYRLVLGLLVVWSLGLSLIARPALAFRQKEGRNPQFLIDAGRSSIGDGGHSVYLGAWQFYFAGRVLGWRMFNPYDGSVSQTLLSSVDYAVFLSREVDEALGDKLSAAGLHFIKIVSVDEQNQLNGSNGLSMGGGGVYGPFAFYGR